MKAHIEQHRVMPMGDARLFDIVVYDAMRYLITDTLGEHVDAISLPADGSHHCATFSKSTDCNWVGRLEIR